MGNEILFKWFDQGEIVSALLGNGNYFIPDHTYVENHDRLLVIKMLYLWADTRDKRKVVSRDFLNALDQLFKLEEKEAFRLALSYYIVKNSSHIAILDELQLINKVNFFIRQSAQEISKNEDLRAVVLALESYFPTVG